MASRSPGGPEPSFRPGLDRPPDQLFEPTRVGPKTGSTEFEPSGGPIRQKSAFLPEHPDNRRISAHIGLGRRRLVSGAKPFVMRDSCVWRVTRGVNRTQEVGGSNPTSSAPLKESSAWRGLSNFGDASDWRDLGRVPRSGAMDRLGTPRRCGRDRSAHHSNRRW
jgi:hypothetical protein